MEYLTCSEYEALKDSYIRGWKTWNVNSVLSHVYMPHGLALNLCIKEYSAGGYLRETLIGRFPEKHERTPKETVYPENHAFDGSYTDLTVSWCGLEFRVETVVVNDEWYMLITPGELLYKPAMLVLETGFAWNRAGTVRRSAGCLTAENGAFTKTIRALGSPMEDVNLASMTQYLSLAMDGPSAFYTGAEQGMDTIQAYIVQGRKRTAQRQADYGELAGMYQAMECAVAWDTVYDAVHNRVITPVSRLWSIGSGGYVLFCWDTFFAAYMASAGDKALSYSNLIEIVNERTEKGFVPNFAYATGQKSEDRSQPPVGAAMLLEVYRSFGEIWIVKLLYPALLTWNTWFWEHRSTRNGTFCWGSDPIAVQYGNRWETEGVASTYGGALESGLDNSPMYDDIPYDTRTHMLMLEDVGLTGLMILDCRSLLQLAHIQGLKEDTDLLTDRLKRAEDGLERLWSEEAGFYLNRRTDTGQFSKRLSPTNFYALFSDRVTPDRKERIAGEHYENPDEFYGEWMLPSIARNDPAYADQDYWRGRIWGPLNFLVYMALGYQGMEVQQKDLAAKSRSIFLKEWEAHRHVHENYNAVTGEGCDAHNSDKFYHWGALLTAICLAEEGKIGMPGRNPEMKR